MIPDEELPEGWACAAVADVTETVPNIKPEDEPERLFAYIDISSIDNQSNRITAAKMVAGKEAPSRARRPLRPQDVLFSNVRTYLRNIALVPDSIAADVCSTGFTVLRANSAVDPRYLFRYVLTDEFVRQTEETQTGTHYPATSDRAVMGLPIPLPPLAEQRRIVAKVEEVLGRVTAARERLANVPAILKRFRQAVLAAACCGRLTEDWREKHPNAQAKAERGETGPLELPAGWKWVRFGSMIHSIRSGSTVPPQNDPSPFPILRSSSVRPGFVDLEDIRYLQAESSENEDNYLKEADLLFTRLSGSLDFVGNCAHVPALNGRRIQYPDRLFCAKLKDPSQGDYFTYAFACPFVRDELTDGAKSSAGHQRISMGNITNQPVPVPPAQELEEIVRRVDALFKLADGIERRVSAASQRVDRLTQAVLAKAFRGELVPTEAELARAEGRDYEPASALLERVRSEREQQPRKTGRRRNQ